MIALLIPIAIICFALNASITRTIQLKFPGKRGTLRLYQSIFCIFAALAFGLSQLFGGGLSIGVTEIITGILFGVFYFTAVIGSSTGYELGSMSLTSIILNMSLFIPLMYSVLILGEALGVLQIFGIILIAVTMYLAVEPNNKQAESNASEKNKSPKTSLLWFAIVLMAFAANGITAVIQKRYVTSGGEAVMSFMSIAYLTAAVFFFVCALIEGKRRGEAVFANPLPIIALSAVSGLGSFGGNALLGYLCDKIDGAVLYPLLNGGLCILSALLSFTIFRERITRRKLCAIAVGICAIVILNI